MAKILRRIIGTILSVAALAVLFAASVPSAKGSETASQRSTLAPGYGTGSAFCAAAAGPYGGHALGASFENVYACGPTGTFAVPPFELPADSHGGFQCVELAERFLWDQYGRTPVSVLVGGMFASVVGTNYGIPVGNSGSTLLPVAGDIISMWGGSSHQSQNGSSSHVAVVTHVAGSLASGASIAVMEENGSPSGSNTITVLPGGKTWSYNGGWFASFNWLELGDRTRPTLPSGVQLTPAPDGSATATLTWKSSADSGGSGLAGYSLQVNGTPVPSAGPTATSYVVTGLNCASVNTITIAAFDNADNTSASVTISNVVLGACLQAQALNHIVTVGGGASYYYDASGLRSLDDANTYWCLIDQGKPVYSVATQTVAKVLGSGKPTYPECLSLNRLYGHTVRNSQTGAAYIVTSNGTSHGLWHWEVNGGIYQCLLGSFPLLNADTAEIESLRQNGFNDGATADCPPTTPTSLTVTGATQTALTLSWHAAANDDSYTVLLDGSPVASVNGTSYTFTNLKCSSTYSLGVRANDVVGLASSAASANGATASCPPKYTLSISLTGTGSGSVVSSPAGRSRKAPSI